MFYRNEKDYNIIDTLTRLMGLYNVPDDCKAHIQDALLAYDSYFNDKYAEIAKLMQEWSGRLGKYYKLSREEGKNYQDVLYVYPYRITASNHTLWWLMINYNSNYNGGVTDNGIGFEDMVNDYTITEITKDEFLQRAKDSVEHVVERRLKREIEKAQEECSIK